MTTEQIQTLRNEIEGFIQAGASTDEIETWGDSYAFSRRHLVEVIRLLVDEVGEYRSAFGDLEDTD